jgi:hypothetical protein
LGEWVRQGNIGATLFLNARASMRMHPGHRESFRNLVSVMNRRLPKHGQRILLSPKWNDEFPIIEAYANARSCLGHCNVSLGDLMSSTSPAAKDAAAHALAKAMLHLGLHLARFEDLVEKQQPHPSRVRSVALSAMATRDDVPLPKRGFQRAVWEWMKEDWRNGKFPPEWRFHEDPKVTPEAQYVSWSGKNDDRMTFKKFRDRLPKWLGNERRPVKPKAKKSRAV